MGGPYDDLEPERSAGTRPTPADAPVRRDIGAMVAFARGATRRCPRCGSGRLFERWFRIRTRCPRCGLRLEREEGGFLGAMTVNYVVTAVVWVGLLIAWLVADLPDVNVLGLTLASIGVALVVPLLFWPFSKTIWAAVDYLVYRSDPEYAARDAADRSSGNGGTP
jgi:uncharacterized protein (DUF983 family)